MEIKEATHAIIVRSDFDRGEDEDLYIVDFCQEEPGPLVFMSFLDQLKNEEEFNWVWPEIEAGIFKVEIISGEVLENFKNEMGG